MSFHPEHDALSGLRDSMRIRAMPPRTSGPGGLAMLGWSGRERLDNLHPLVLLVGDRPVIMSPSLIRKQGCNEGRKADRQAMREGGKVSRHAGRGRRREAKNLLWQ